MQNRQIVFTKLNTAELLDAETAMPRDDELLVETAFSAISAGTEKANIVGDPSISTVSKGDEPAVFPRYA